MVEIRELHMHASRRFSALLQVLVKLNIIKQASVLFSETHTLSALF